MAHKLQPFRALQFVRMVKWLTLKQFMFSFHSSSCNTGHTITRQSRNTQGHTPTTVTHTGKHTNASHVNTRRNITYSHWGPSGGKITVHRHMETYRGAGRGSLAPRDPQQLDVARLVSSIGQHPFSDRSERAARGGCRKQSAGKANPHETRRRAPRTAASCHARAQYRVAQFACESLERRAGPLSELAVRRQADTP